jgi:DtxR family Mn-dependent transcriptional regulator
MLGAAKIVSLSLLAAGVAAAALLWPRRGVLARWRNARALAARTRREDILKQILKCEVNEQPTSLLALAGALQVKPSQVAALLVELEDRGLISYSKGPLALSPGGRELALHVIRAHRLWESYLADQTGVAEAEWHQRAESQEHLITPQQADALAAQLGDPRLDPHGDYIPAPGGELAAEAGQSLNAAALHAPVVITHLEDEPETIYAQLSAQGLRPGMKACVLEKTPQRIRFWAGGGEHVLAPVLADNISVRLLPELRAQDLFEEEYLAALKPGQRGKVLDLSPACRGAERRRLLDLGFVPGTVVETELLSPTGDPTAYRVRGSVVALRREQAGLIRVSRLEPSSP